VKLKEKNRNTLYISGLRLLIGAYRLSPIPSIQNLETVPSFKIRRLLPKSRSSAQ